MKNFQSIRQNQHDESNECDALINRPTSNSTYGSDAEGTKHYQSIQLDIQQDYHGESNDGDAPFNRYRQSSFKRYVLLSIVALGFLLAYNLQGTTQDNAPSNANTAASLLVNYSDDDFMKEFNEVFVDDDNSDLDFASNEETFDFLFSGCSSKEDCDDGQFCCRNTCKSCCQHRDCVQKIVGFPPAGEFGASLCIDDECQTYSNGESSQIPFDGVYPVWVPSETLDKSQTFHQLNIPRKAYNDGPLMEQVWRIDFSEQDASFEKDKVVYNGTHITIPSFQNIHTSYSRSYNHLDEHETGVTALIMGDNKYSVVADFPKIVFIEKYHTLTYDGKQDTSRGDYIKEKAEEQLAQEPVFDKRGWFRRNHPQTLWIGLHNTIQRQVEASLDKALAWQIRRFVKTYPKEDFGSVNPSTSASWASHSEKAQQAIDYAKDPSFKRDYMKSETHCKHFEDLEGVSFTEDSVTFPVGRPITGFTGEMVLSPVHYVGFGVGHITLYYDPNTSVLEIFYQTFSHARQHSDVKFPGPDPEKGNALYVAPVADGEDYIVDPDRDGRTDSLFLLDAPGGYPLGRFGGEPDLTVWARPTEDVCSEEYRDGKFWEMIDGNKFDYGSYSDMIIQQPHTFRGVVGGMPCAGNYMKTDYGGGNGFGPEEIGVWQHSLVEIRSDVTRDMLLATFWDGWECFYHNKC